ncbi:uncharacterized protein PgNI_00827 [Pyricularia grisea]|uniref:Uncharacterized protein n=1 Tax=Pyricularia grisea TaxID=148305 RepID=A0A6P8BFX5_PYRGI|nr:uncharacterized protein PgNI_00827 [Pyricularia grisea]TLD15519.1 hypothetical protein PgNI_00827 [Pyricularia grisea]
MGSFRAPRDKLHWKFTTSFETPAAKNQTTALVLKRPDDRIVLTRLEAAQYRIATLRARSVAKPGLTGQ